MNIWRVSYKVVFGNYDDRHYLHRDMPDEQRAGYVLTTGDSLTSVKEAIETSANAGCERVELGECTYLGVAINPLHEDWPGYYCTLNAKPLEAVTTEK